MNKISIIIPIYNAESTIKKCLKSIINQEYKNIEIILVNDGSSDKTERIIEEFFLDKRIKYYRQENSGVSVTRNLGISKATGDYIFFIDADDTIDEMVIKDLVDNVSENNLVGIMHKFNMDEKCKNKEKYSSKELLTEILSSNILGVVWGYLFKTSIVKNMLFDKNTGLLEDTIFLVEYLKNSNINEVKFIDNGNYYNYIQNFSSITADGKRILKKCKDFEYSLNKINELTNNKFNDLIEEKKIILLEKELRFIKNKEILKDVYRNININIKKYKGNNKRLKIFSYIYRHKMFNLLVLYYKIRAFIKNFIKK